MGLFGKALDQLRETDLRDLVEDKIREQTLLEFKREMYARGADGQRELLRDICAMANADGGFLIIGVEEDGEGVATALRPVPLAETEAARIISLSLAHIAERIPGLRALPVPVGIGHALVVQVPRSYRRPHMVTFDGKTEFWIRHDRQKSCMSITEIRLAVSTTEELEVKANRFIDERRRQLAGRSESLQLTLTGTPLLLEDGRVDVSAPALSALLKDPPTFRPRVGASLSHPSALIQPTLRGLQAVVSDRQTLEVFRNGHVEFVAADRGDLISDRVGDGAASLPGWVIAEYIRNFVYLLRDLGERTTITDPYLVSVSLWRCQGVYMGVGVGPPFGRNVQQWQEGDDLLLTPVVAPMDEEADQVVRRVCDRFWNAFHHMRCPFFDSAGRFYIPNR